MTTHYEEEIHILITKNAMISESLKTALAMIQMDFDATVKHDIKALVRSMRVSYGANLHQISKLIKHKITNNGFKKYCVECGDIATL